MLTTVFGLPEQCQLLFWDIISPDIFVFEIHYRQSPHAFPVTTKPLVHMGITGEYKNNVVVIKISWCPCEQLWALRLTGGTWTKTRRSFGAQGASGFTQHLINPGFMLLGPARAPNPANPRGCGLRSLNLGSSLKNIPSV